MTLHPTQHLARTVTSMVAERTQCRNDLDVDIRQFDIDTDTALTVISLHDGSNRLTISTSTIRHAASSYQGLISVTYRTAVGTPDEQFTLGMESTINHDFIAPAELHRLSRTLDGWMNVSLPHRRQLAHA